MGTYNDKMSSIYNLTLEHYQELEKNIGYCDNIADIKSKIKDEGVTEINILNELNVDEPDTSLVFASILKSKKNVVLSKFINDYLSKVGFGFEVKRPVITAEKKYRIDILIEDKDYAIIIENKLLGAVYQRNQLSRYIKRIENEGYKPEQIFIVIIPDYYTDDYLDNIRRSVWKLPHDWVLPNSQRECAWHDEYCCQCDNSLNTEYEDKNCHKPEKNCINYKNLYKERTVILDNSFSDWLLECSECIDKKEVLLHSALIQFSDYIKIRYNQKQSDEYIMEMKEFLRSKLVKDNKNDENNWKIVNEKISQIDDMKRGLESLKQEISKNMINEWRDNLKAMGWNLSFEESKSFGINIKGVWCGCWSGCEGNGKSNNNQPYWGFYSDKEFTDEQKEMIDSILEYSGLVKSVNKGKEFIAWNSTLNGDKRCNQLYEASEALGYIKR